MTDQQKPERGRFVADEEKVPVFLLENGERTPYCYATPIDEGRRVIMHDGDDWVLDVAEFPVTVDMVFISPPDNTGDSLKMGRVVAGPYYEPQRNYSAGWEHLND